MTSELPIADLPDDEVMALANMQMAEDEQGQLSELLSLNREGQLNDGQRVELEALLQVYRRGLRRKAQAIKVALERGLMNSLS